MRILFAWTGLTSYMADCWRRLAAEQGVALKVWIDSSSAVAQAVDFETAKLMEGIDFSVAHAGDPACLGQDLEAVVAWKPDVLFVVGWRSAFCRAIVVEPRLKRVPKICCFDMPWRWQMRCLLAPLVLGGFLRRYQAAFVPGAVCARYAKWLGFRRIYRGLFAIDTEKFHSSPQPSTPNPQPYFLYLGRNSAEKRLADLRAAHRLYRERGGSLDLRMYGKGLEGGFVKPEDVPSLMRGAAAFVLASDFDPWPLVLLEAMSAGCPVVASDRCTNRPELGQNWHVFRCGDVDALARTMENVAQSGRDAARARENLELARQYDCANWIVRVKTIVGEVVR